MKLCLSALSVVAWVVLAVPAMASEVLQAGQPAFRNEH